MKSRNSINNNTKTSGGGGGSSLHAESMLRVALQLSCGTYGV
jgi:hypothetical protein